MRSFIIGLLVGALLGGGVVYLAVSGSGAGEEAVADAGDAGAQAVKRGRKRRPKRHKKRPRQSKRAAATTTRQVPEEKMVAVSARDQELIWKGQKVALSERDIDMTESLGGRSLSPGEISEALEPHSQAFGDCIVDARGDARLRHCEITLMMLVEGNGRVSRVRIRAPRYLHAHGLYPCMQGEARGIDFAATGGQTVVTLPFELF